MKFVNFSLNSKHTTAHYNSLSNHLQTPSSFISFSRDWTTKLQEFFDFLHDRCNHLEPSTLMARHPCNEQPSKPRNARPLRINNLPTPSRVYAIQVNVKCYICDQNHATHTCETPEGYRSRSDKIDTGTAIMRELLMQGALDTRMSVNENIILCYTRTDGRKSDITASPYDLPEGRFRDPSVTCYGKN